VTKSRIFGVFAIAVALCAAAPRPLLALDPSRALTQYALDIWTPAQGAPFGTVTSIAQTPDGYLWLGTHADGLFRFDGVRFTPVPEIDRLLGRTYRITKVVATPDGTVWVATQVGLARGGSAPWQKVTAASVIDLTVTDGGDLLVGLRESSGTPAGIYAWKGHRLEVRAPHSDWRSIRGREAGDLWLTSDGSGLLRLQGENLTRLTRADGLLDNDLNAIDVGPAKDVWVLGRSGLNHLRDGVVQDPITSAHGLPSDDLTVVFDDGQGSVWVGTGSSGIARVRGRQIDTFGKLQGLPDTAVFGFYEDLEGSLWMAMGSGLARLRTPRFTAYGEPEGLSVDRVTSVAEGTDGRMLLWSDGGGLTQLQDGRVERTYTRRDGLLSNFGGPLFVSRDGSVWIGHDRGLSRVKDGRTTAYGEGLLADRYVSTITEDSESVIAFVLTAGLVRMVDGKAVPYLDRDTVTGETLHMPFTSRWTRDGTLWLGTAKGAWTLSKGVLRKVWDMPTGLPMVAWIHEDAAGTIWLGTWEGLFRLAGGTTTSYGPTQGLPNYSVTNILEDAQGYFWLGTSRGILRVQRKELDDVAGGRAARVHVEEFGASDGMRMAEVNAAAQPSGCVDRRGRLWFATRAGALMVNPARMERNTLVPRVVIEEVVVGGTALDPSAVRLQPGTTRLEIRYTALSLLVPEKVRFRFKLEGFDRDWIDAGPSRIATYTKLPPGSFRFRVLAANNDGLWNESGATLDVRQLPRFYETTWFLVLSIASVVAGGVGIHKLRVRKHRRLARELQARIALATAEIRTLSGLLPICAWCKKIRDDTGYWGQIETYVSQRTEAQFTHGICPDCVAQQLAAQHNSRPA
jgi:ligand-binding sensor domain-containing protein